MSPDANKGLVRRVYAEVVNGRDLDAIDRLLTPDFAHHGEALGRELRVEGGMIAEAWDEVDLMGLTGS